MARTPFSIVERKNGTKRVFMARFLDSRGKIIRTTTFHANSRTAAAHEAEKLLKNGVISNAANPDALDYLRSFWKRESDYVQGRALRGVIPVCANIDVA